MIVPDSEPEVAGAATSGAGSAREDSGWGFA